MGNLDSPPAKTNSPIRLGYGGRPKARLLRRLVVLTVLLVLVGSAVYFREAISAYAVERYQAWRFARTFDRAVQATAGRGTLWAAFGEGGGADKYLKDLIAESGPYTVVRNAAGQDRVLFVRSGSTGGERWLAFGCISPIGVGIYTFERGDRDGSSYDLAFTMKQFRSPSWVQTPPRFVLDQLSQAGEVIKTSVRIADGSNIIDWSITSAPPVPGRRNTPRTLWSGPPPLMVCKVDPKTGWISYNDWLPRTSGFELTESHAVPKEIPAIPGSLAMSFLPDGRIAMLAPGKLAFVDVASGTVDIQPMKELERAELAVFSPSGTKCFVGGMVGTCYIVDTLTRRLISLGESYGIPRPFFLNDDTLIVKDNIHLRRFDCTTGRATEEEMPAKDIASYVRQSDTIAFFSYISQGIHLRRGNSIEAVLPEDTRMNLWIWLSPDGKWLSINRQWDSAIVDTDTGKLLCEYPLPAPTAWTRDSQLGASVREGYIYLWRFGQQPRSIVRLPLGDYAFQICAALSPDGTAMAASRYKKSTIAYWKNFLPTTRPAD